MTGTTSVKVPFFDWAGLYAERADEFDRIISATLRRGGFILQKDVDEFEQNLARYLGIKHVVALADGTNAILLGLRAIGLRPGDEVIIQSHSFIAAAQSIHFAGGVPVPIELGDDWLMDVSAIEAAITPRTRAIMPVHVNGRICDMDPILDIARKHGLIVVEDSAQALGATYKGRPAGGFGAFGAFSFYPSKSLGSFGDAGALVTNDDAVADQVRWMRNHGANSARVIDTNIDIWGTNSRLDNVQAAILNYKLKFYDAAISRRREIAARYHSAFRGLSGVDLPPPPDRDRDRFDIFQNYEMCVDDRDGLRTYLAECGIGTIVQWGGFGIHRLKNLGFTQSLPRTDEFFRRSVLLPMNHILTDAQVDHIIACVGRFCSRPAAA